MGVAFVGVVAGILALRGGKSAPLQVVVSTAEVVAPPKLVAAVQNVALPQVDARPAPPAAALPPAKQAARATEHTEAEIMAKLRELGATNPALTLKLAREGNQRFKHSPDAPERASESYRESV